MTTAREQSREAAKAKITPYALETAEAAADAASDVWESTVESVLAIAQDNHIAYPKAMNVIVKLCKEALGED